VERRRHEPRDRVGDEVGVVLRDVDRRRRLVAALPADRPGVRSGRDGGLAVARLVPLVGTALAAVPRPRDGDAAHDVSGAADERAERGAGQEEDAGDRQQDAEDRAAGMADAEADDALEPGPEQPSVRAPEREQQPEQPDREPEPERAHVDELAAGDYEGADRDERERQHVRGPADRGGGGVADGAAREPEPEDAGEEDAERAGGEAGE